MPRIDEVFEFSKLEKLDPVVGAACASMLRVYHSRLNRLSREAKVTGKDVMTRRPITSLFYEQRLAEVLSVMASLSGGATPQASLHELALAVKNFADLMMSETRAGARQAKASGAQGGKKGKSSVQPERVAELAEKLGYPGKISQDEFLEQAAASLHISRSTVRRRIEALESGRRN